MWPRLASCWPSEDSDDNDGDNDNNDHDDNDDRVGSEEAGASTLDMWRIVAREAGVRGHDSPDHS